MPYKAFQGSLDATDLRVGVVVSRFNEFITEQLAKGALETLAKKGCVEENITFVKVPGAWELPVAAKALASSCDAIVALGAVSLEQGFAILGGSPEDCNDQEEYLA